MTKLSIIICRFIPHTATLHRNTVSQMTFHMRRNQTKLNVDHVVNYMYKDLYVSTSLFNSPRFQLLDRLVRINVERAIASYKNNDDSNIDKIHSKNSCLKFKHNYGCLKT